MLLCPITRSKLLQFLPRGGEVAEIGVANGDFSHEILTAVAPARLHLIDPWEHQDRADYAKDVSNVAEADQEGRFNAVLARFCAEIDRQTVRVYRDYSDDAAVFLKDGQLDWIYIDGMHTEEAAYGDLITYQHKVKPDGFIVGHDYTNHVQAQQWNFGVVEAVNRFVRETGYEFVALTLEAFPTYLLAKDRARATALKQALILNVPYAVEIRDYPGDRRFEHNTIALEKGMLVYPSF